MVPEAVAPPEGSSLALRQMQCTVSLAKDAAFITSVKLSAVWQTASQSISAVSGVISLEPCGAPLLQATTLVTTCEFALKDCVW